MKREQLLDAVGGLDETMLMESEQKLRRGGKTAYKIVLVAAAIAALAATAAATAGLFSRPIGGSEIITDETIAPFSMDSEGNIIMEGVEGLKVTMEVEVNEDAPDVLEEFYVLEMSDEWHIAGGGGSGDGYFRYSQGYEWKKGDLPGRVRLNQDITYWYEAGVYGENCVDTLSKLTAADGVTAETTEFAGISVLKVTIPALPRYKDGPSIDGYYCVDGETRLYWTDGDYMLMFAYPAWMSDKEAEELMLSLEKQPFVDPRPEDYGKVNPESIAQRLPDLSIGMDNGTSCANSTMGLGKFAYGDGSIYCAGEGCIYRYEIATGNTEKMVLSSPYADPDNILVTGDHILYTDSWSDFVALSKDGATEEFVFQGFHLGHLYAEGTTVYITEGIIDLRTGTVTSWPEGVHSFYVDDTYIYALQEDENCFLRAPKGTMDFQKIPVSFCPIRVLADGEDIYMSRGGADKTWTVIRYRDGEETELPIRALEFQVFDGHIIYCCEEEERWAIKSYNLETGEIRVLHEEGFNFSVLEDRYVCILCADGNGQSYHTVIDWQTGERYLIDVNG